MGKKKKVRVELRKNRSKPPRERQWTRGFHAHGYEEQATRPDERGAYQVLSVVASDRPGLLYGIARTLARYGINLQTARINTLGDRVEDVFLVSGESLASPKTVLQVEQDLLKELQISV